MKTKFLITVLIFILPAYLFAQQTYVPDDNFEQALINVGLDVGPILNDSVPTKNIDTVIEIYLMGKNISDLTGIEDFTALRELYCGYNNLTSLDLSNNTALEILFCWSNDLTSLDLSKNSALKILDCYWNSLKSLDLCNNSDLEVLECEGNNLTSLDLSNNTALQKLYCYSNELTSLDLRNNTALQKLYCYSNELSSLDVINNTALQELECNSNHLTRLDVINNIALYYLSCVQNELASLDVSNNAVLKFLFCDENELTSLDIRNGNNKNMTGIEFDDYFNASNNPNLECLQVDDSTWSANNKKWRKDDHAHYSEDCGYTGIDFRAEDETDNISISSSPNPFSQSTMINYQLAMPGRVVLKVYDNLGQEISTLIDEFKDAGEHQAQFNADNLPQGIYFYKIQIDKTVESGKLLLIK